MKDNADIGVKQKTMVQDISHRSSSTGENHTKVSFKPVEEDPRTEVSWILIVCPLQLPHYHRTH